MMKCDVHTHFFQTLPNGQTSNAPSSADMCNAVIPYLVVAFEAADHAGDLVDQAKVMD